MVIVYKAAPSEEIFLESDLFTAFNTADFRFSEKKRALHIAGSVANQYQAAFRDISLWHNEMSLQNDLTLNVHTSLPTVRMIFSLSSNILFENYSGGNDIFSFSPNQHNIIFAPPLNGRLSLKAAAETELFEIILHPAFVLRYLPQAELFDTFSKAIASKQFAMLSAYNLPVTAEMKMLLKDIIHCEKNPELKRIYIEARVTEMLMLQLEQYIQIAGNAICNTLRKTDIQKMHHVRTIIDNSWKEPCSLIDLAQQVTTNEYNLKKSFKEVFGTTIFGYLNDVKMNEAKKLLLTGNKNIAEVADIVGYKNPNHFTTAFKKYFGYVPSELK